MKIICKTTFGSHLYGTATPTSDEDVRGIFLPSTRDILLGRIPRTNKDNGESKVDYELYSLHHFLKLACDGQTVAIDILWTPKHLVINDSPIWDDLISLREKFLSKRMSAFIGYARNQASKYSLKGERLSRLQNFYDKIKEAHPETTLEIAFDWNKLPIDDKRINPQNVPELQIAGKWYTGTTPMKYILQTVSSQIKRYGNRSQNSIEGVDWKATSHAVRVCYELKELLETSNLEFPLKERNTVLEIKTGQKSLEEVQELIDVLLADVEELMAKSTLPETTDHKFWDDWLANEVRKEIFLEETLNTI